MKISIALLFIAQMLFAQGGLRTPASEKTNPLLQETAAPNRAGTISKAAFLNMKQCHASIVQVGERDADRIKAADKCLNRAIELASSAADFDMCIKIHSLINDLGERNQIKKKCIDELGYYDCRRAAVQQKNLDKKLNCMIDYVSSTPTASCRDHQKEILQAYSQAKMATQKAKLSKAQMKIFDAKFCDISAFPHSEGDPEGVPAGNKPQL